MVDDDVAGRNTSIDHNFGLAGNVVALPHHRIIAIGKRLVQPFRTPGLCDKWALSGVAKPALCGVAKEATIQVTSFGKYLNVVQTCVRSLLLSLGCYWHGVHRFVESGMSGVTEAGSVKSNFEQS